MDLNNQQVVSLTVNKHSTVNNCNKNHNSHSDAALKNQTKASSTTPWHVARGPWSAGSAWNPFVAGTENVGFHDMTSMFVFRDTKRVRSEDPGSQLLGSLV